MKMLLFLLVTGSGLADTSFDVVHKKRLWFDQEGTVRIDASGISFQPAGKDEKTRSWGYEDIQFLDRMSPTEFRLLTYEDVAWRLGQDRRYHFELSSGEFSNELFAEVSARMGKPVTDRVVTRPDTAEQELLVKHLTRFGGSEGTLFFTPERIVYATDARKGSRQWHLARDVQSVWSVDRYRLEIHVYEDNPGEFRQARVYKFVLKEPLDAQFYRRLKLKLYGLERTRDAMP